jgi:hypothetical protein
MKKKKEKKKEEEKEEEEVENLGKEGPNFMSQTTSFKLNLP